jgi:hypothetical protein
MRRIASVGALLTVLVLSSAGVALAQSASPGATAPPAATGGAVPIVDAAGIQVGTVTVKNLADPFMGFDQNAPPPEGSRYVLLTTVFEAAEDQALTAEPGGIVLQSSDGFLVGPSRVPRPPDAVIPEIQSQQMAPGDRISGVIGYIVPDTLDVARVVYRADGSRFLPLVETAKSASVPVGTAVPFIDAEGVARGTVTVREVVDPFTDFDPGSPPPDGQRFVMVTPVFEASEAATMQEDPNWVYLVDDRGFVYRIAYVRPAEGFAMPGLEGQTLAPGDRVSGVVGFVLPADARVATVIYAPAWDRIVSIASIAPGA